MIKIIVFKSRSCLIDDLTCNFHNVWLQNTTVIQKSVKHRALKTNIAYEHKISWNQENLMHDLKKIKNFKTPLCN